MAAHVLAARQASKRQHTCTIYPVGLLMRAPKPETMPHDMMRVVSQVEDPKMRRSWLEGICTDSNCHCSPLM